MGTPVLWHIPPSHYNEKVRWALDAKGVAHERRAVAPPATMLVGWWLTRSPWFPVLVLDGRAIGDSTAIIAALEERYPDVPLYPADSAERARALALEEFFDEEAGPAARLVAFHELRRTPGGLADFSRTLLPGPLARSGAARRAAGLAGSVYVEARYRVAGEEAAQEARRRVVAAFDRLEVELARGMGEHLVGESFTVADLTAASILYPLVQPPEGPWLPSVPPGLTAFMDTLRGRPGFAWVAATFARHRHV